MRIRFFSTFLLVTALCPLDSSVVIAQDSEKVASGCYQTPAKDCLPRVDIPLKVANSYHDLSRAYSELAWQDFLALSLPVAAADAGGKFTSIPDPASGLSSYSSSRTGSYKTVWGTFTSADDLFQTGGVEPKEFGSLPVLPRACSDRLTEDQKKLPVLSNIAKSGIQDEYVQANRMGPVIDQNGNYLRYGIGFNNVMHDYVVKQKLFSIRGQEDYGKANPSVLWPSGDNSSHAIGSIFVKSSWKIIAGNDKPDDFYTMNALIYTPEHGTFGEEPTVEKDDCEVKQVGLVGLHIVHRTPSAPQWVWATFEHTKNAPYHDEIDTQEEVKALREKKASYSLFDIDKCAGAAGSSGCQINQVPAHPWNPLVVNKAKATQVVRMVRPGKIATDINSEVAKALESNKVAGPWKNYFLVDVQFPTVLGLRDTSSGVAKENSAYPDGVPTPSFLANSTMETYIQGLSAEQNAHGTPPASGGAVSQSADSHGAVLGVPRVTSSCISCHYDATTSTGTNSNFVFSLSRVKK